MKDLLLIDNKLLNNFWVKIMKKVNYLQNKPLLKVKTIAK